MPDKEVEIREVPEITQKEYESSEKDAIEQNKIIIVYETPQPSQNDSNPS